MNPANRNALVVFLALPLTLAGCASAPRESDTSVEWNLRHMHFARALELARAGVQEHPDDAAAQELLRRASVAALMEEGRRLTLADQDVEALGAFRKALDLDPNSFELASWIDKTQKKLCDAWLQVALEEHASGRLEPAIDAYEQALRFQPGHEMALGGMDQAVREVNHREYLAKKYFEEGVHALADYWLERSNSRFSYSNKYKPGQERTATRTKQVKLLLAQQRQRVAVEFEKILLFGAARNEYRMALALAPDDAASAAALERCTREVKAQRKLEDANYQIMRGEYDRANKLIDEGLALTEAQKESFEGARSKIQERMHESLYNEALALERDQRFPEAIAKYQELLQKAQYYKDVFARIDTLQGYVQLAGELFKKFEEAADDKVRLEFLQQIRVFWPEYRDIGQRIVELERKSAN